MKKVLFLQNIGRSYGGVWQVNKMIGEELIKRGYDVSIVSIRNNKNNLKLEYDKNLKVFTINEKNGWGTFTTSEIIYSLKKLKFKAAIEETIEKIKYIISLKKDIKKLYVYIRNSKPDYIVTSHYQLLDMIPKEYLCKTINEQHSSYKDAMSHKATYKTLQKYKNKVKFLWLTSKTMENAANDGLINSDYIYNPVRFKSDRAADVAKNKKLITIARLSEIKRLDLMINIVEEVFKDEKYKDWSFEIYGSGDEEKKLDRMIKNRKQIKLMGLTDNPKEKFLMSSINLNTSRFEGFCLSILEANECGVPTITFNFGESVEEEIIDGKTGIVVNNREEFVKNLKELMENRAKLKRYSVNCKKFSEKFHVEKIIDKWIELFNEVDLSKSKKRVMFISSTGGHLEELFQLKDMFSKYDYHIVTEKTKSNLSLKNKYSNRVSFLIYGTYTTLGKKVIYPFKLLLNCFKSLFIFIKIRPQYIISTGAHTAGPMCCIGKIFGSKIIFIETFANSKTKSRTGSLIYKFADLFIVQWEELLELYPNAVYGGWIF